MRKNITKKNARPKIHKGEHKHKQGALILDRDGVLITRAFLTWKKSQMKLSPGIARAIAAFNARKIPVLVITNQPVVARGWITERGVQQLHDYLSERLRKQGAVIDAFYFCPHHPEATLAVYRKVCSCRKPAIGMFKQAAREGKFDLSKSVVIGDQTQDILAGKRAKVKTILVRTGFGGSDKKYNVAPDYTVKDVPAAMKVAVNILMK